MGARTAIKYLFFTSLWIFAVVLIQPHWTVFEHEDLFKVIAKQLNQILSFLYDVALGDLHHVVRLHTTFSIYSAYFLLILKFVNCEKDF